MKNNSSEISKKIFIPIVELIKIKKFDEALTLLEKLSDQDPDIVNRLKGSIYLNKKEWNKSLFYYQKNGQMALFQHTAFAPSNWNYGRLFD